MYKLICTDVDGTLVDGQGRLLDRDRDALRHAIYEEGVKVAIISGRFRQGVQTVINKLDLPVWTTSFNGQYVEAGRDNAVLDLAPDHERLSTILKAINEHGCYPMLFGLDDWYVQSKGIWYEKQLKVFSPEGGHVCNLQEVLDGPTRIYKILAKNEDHEVLEELRVDLEARHIPGAKFFFSNPNIFESILVDANKGTALEAYMKYMGIPREQTMSFGDYDNDIELIKAAGLGICMENGTDAAKAVAGFVTKSVFEGGIAYALEKFL